MNDDVIKLREALYAAEPFLTFLLNERTMERNTTHLEKALSMVRGALDMPQFDLPKQPVPETPSLTTSFYEDRIKITEFIEHADGGVTATMEFDEQTARLILGIGMNQLIRELAEEKRG